MFSISIRSKEKSGSKDVSLRIVIFKTGHTRVVRSLNITGKSSEWDEKEQTFKGKGSEIIVKNSILMKEKLKFQKKAEEWEMEGFEWTPSRLSSFFDDVKGKAVKQHKQRDIVGLKITVQSIIEEIIDNFKNNERFKNGVIIKGSSNADNYWFLRKSLESFTKSKFNKTFESYIFDDIDERFLNYFCVYIAKKGAENGNKGGLRHKLKTLRAVCSYAVKKGVLGASVMPFMSVQSKMKISIATPRVVSVEVIRKIENMDRSWLTGKEIFHLDLFLFSYYTGGMANVDVCHLKKTSVLNNMIVYERMKCDREAKPILIQKAKDIINKYKHLSCFDYVLPVFNKKQITDSQKTMKVKRTTRDVNNTMKKISKRFKITEPITWYAARGTYITKMIDEGYNPVFVSEQAGNSPDIITKHYYRTTNQDAMLKKIEGLYSFFKVMSIMLKVCFLYR